MKCSIFGLLAVFLTSNAWAADAVVSAATSHGGACRSVYFSPLSALDHELQIGEFRIHYTLRGSHSLETVTDADKNGTPDVIEDLALQLNTANDLYRSVIGLRHPLEQARYVEAQQINVYVLALNSGNGLAFDEVVSERIRQKSMECGLRMFVDRRVRPSHNLTPAHELFHLYQYGYAMFKSPWYLEGMARWVESFFSASKPVTRLTGKNAPIACADAYSKSYTAANYWRQRADIDSIGEVAIPAALTARHYSDGRPVIETVLLQGSDFLLHVMQALELASLSVAKAQNLPSYRWPESLQKSKQLDDLICSTVEEVSFE